MDEKVKERMLQKLAEVQLSEQMLTPLELNALYGEVEAELNGETVENGVLSNPEILYRNIGRCDG